MSVGDQSTIHLSDIENRIRACRQCGLHNNRTFGVAGEGPVNADIVIIGEAPGDQENRTGKPFIGYSGQLLTKILQDAGYSRADTYITNMVKCWVGDGNPDPKQHEIDACAPWLDQQLKLIKPKGVITFGRFSTNKFIDFPNKGGIGKIQGHIRRGWWDSTHPTYIMPLYPPAYLARSRDEIPNTMEHLVNFRQLIDDLIW